jgi:signal transduction histidine kinase
MINIQNKRYERIVSYFEEVYRRDGKWTETSGVELMHEAYMSNYCLTLEDKNKNVIWGMDPTDISSTFHINTMAVNEKGVYSTKSFEIKIDGDVVGYVDIGQYSSVLMSEEDVNFKTSINKSIIASGMLTLVIIISISLYFSNQFSLPIKDVARMSVNLSEGNFETKSTTKSRIVELEDLRGSVNILADKLKHQDMLRKRLVSDISHEIRTPLNVLQNNLEAMIDGVFPVTEDRLNYLNGEVIRFGKLLDNLNHLKEFEAECMKLEFENVNLNDLLQDICSDFYVAAENKGIKLRYNLKQESVNHSVIGDKDKLKQVFINLLSNAVKFTKTGGDIWVKLYVSNNDIVAEVEDNGIGIKSEDLPFIFERLYRGDKSRHEIEGSGIGLTIARNILKLHSASVEVESKEGKGTKFKVCFKNKREA